LACYAIGLAGYSGIKIIAPAFYALGDARTPMTVSVASIAVNFLMNWMLVGLLQERGLALSTSVVGLLNFGSLYLILRGRINGIEGRATAIAIAKILGASAVMAAVCLAISGGLPRIIGDTLGARLLIVAGSVGAGALVFYGVASWLNVAELRL